ncbi:putative nuclease HARBI1 [Onthophagus taurus]|uniref:putative nuclease HARBI1 n=1 Tax=Onthophagus taurus TaxID=166361 RepID=UPI0039BEC3A4
MKLISGLSGTNGFPGVIGAIDGSHIKIDKPKNDPDSYLNRKHYFSIQMQVVCDHTRKIRAIFIGYPGSVHDSRVFRTSPLSETLAEKCGELYLLGDSGYPCQRHLLTPFKDRCQLTENQRNFNVKLSSNRYVIEHCFGLLKQRFRQLFHLKLKDISLIANFIRACCVLHNLAVDNDLLVLDDVEDEVNNDIAVQAVGNIANNEEDEADNGDGIQHRNFIANNVLTR